MSTDVLQGTKDRYPIDIGANAMCAAEEAIGMTWPQITKTLRSKRPPTAIVHAFLRAVLIGGTTLDKRALTRILRDIGGMKMIRAALKGAT